MKVLGHGEIRVIVKALILPECIHGRRHIPLPSAQASEARYVLVSDLERGQRLGEHVPVVLWIGAGSWNGSNINDEPHACVSQQVHEHDDRSGRMSDGKKWVSQISKMHMGTTSDVSFFASKKLSRARLRLERSNGAPRRPGVTHALGVRRACVLAVSRHLHGRAPRRRHINQT